MSMSWIVYDKSWREFCNAGLNKSGTQICVQDSYHLAKQYVFLIGDINELGGVCDDCQEVLDTQTVLRYRILIEEN